MNADRDPTRVVRSWLRTDEHESADRVLDIVLASLDTTPQRRHLWPARRLTRMINGTRMAIGAAAAVLVVALLGYNLLPRPAGTATQATAPPTASPTAEPLAGQETLEGRYSIPVLGPVNATVAVPTGWAAGGDSILNGPRDSAAPDGMAVRFYRVVNVVKNPAALGDGLLDPPVGPTVDDLVQAIVDHPSWTASAPVDITMDGHPGQRVSITIPMDATFDAEGNFYLFDDGGGQFWGFAPGQVFDLSIVDVDGDRIVIDAFHYPGTTAEDLAAQQAIVDSIEFDPAP